MSRNSNFIQRGGLWVVGQSVLLFAVVIVGVVSHGDGRNLLVMAAGAVFLVLALGCGLAGNAALGRNLSPFPKPSAHTQLVQSGIYGLMRHPLYTAVFCAAVGWSLVWQSWLALAVSPVLGVFFDAKARREERWLRQQFPEYASYERRVRRFIPWIY
jgi:protein-S-isoprenylcysteine O-methyltransferase Ste14